MIKIICAGLLAAVLVVSLSGCGSKEEHPTLEKATSDHPTSEKATSDHPTSENATSDHPTSEEATSDHPEHPK